jgi:Ca2+-transporting ATPase
MEERTGVLNRWYALDPDDVAQRFASSISRGLSGEEAARRLAEHGPNKLEERGARGPWKILWEQLISSMVVILIVAAVVSAFLDDVKDAVAILVIVVLNALLGFRQEYKAEKAMAALKALAMPTVRVLRDGDVQEISARELVTGDIVILESGNLVPADGRLVEGANLRVEEAALTGESEPVEKKTGALPDEDFPLGDRYNMVYMGTVVTYGRGRAIITETGMNTELGHIASMIQTVQGELTPLQSRLNQLGRGLAVAAMVLVAVIFTLGVFRGEDLKKMFLLAISMAVAAVPEGLPAVVTIALALGSQRMLKRQALIRKLPAVETLGSVTVICSDKTGTLTQNRMTVTTLKAVGHELNIASKLSSNATPENPSAEALRLNKSNPPSMALLLIGGALCNDSFLKHGADRKAEHLQAVGDPTEAAIVIAAARAGLWKEKMERAFPRVGEVPFDSDRKPPM